LKAAWQEQVGYEGMEINDPEEYLLYDVDCDGFPEVVARGAGFNAVFTWKDEPSLIAWSFGEYVTLYVSKSGIVGCFEASGRSEALFCNTYYALKDSKLDHFVCDESAFVDDEAEDETYEKYTYTIPDGESRTITEDEALPYLKVEDFEYVGYLEGWQEIK